MSTAAPVNALHGGQTTGAVIARFRQAQADKVSGIRRYLSSGISSLDTKFPAWLRQGHLITLAGRPGAGKTNLAQQISEYVAQHEGRSVFFFSLEMPAIELLERSVSRRAMISISRLVTNDGLTAAEDLEIERAIKEFDALSLLVWTDCYQQDSILAAIKVAAGNLAILGKPPLGLVVVDYVQKVTGASDDAVFVISMTTGMLKRLAVELDIPVLALAQLNRQAAGRTESRPLQTDLKGSGSIEQDSDLALYIYRECELNGLAEVGTLKVRHIAAGRLTLRFDGEHSTFSDMGVAGSSSAKVPQLSVVGAKFTSRNVGTKAPKVTGNDSMRAGRSGY